MDVFAVYLAGFAPTSSTFQVAILLLNYRHTIYMSLFSFIYLAVAAASIESFGPVKHPKAVGERKSIMEAHGKQQVR